MPSAAPETVPRFKSNIEQVRIIGSSINFYLMIEMIKQNIIKCIKSGIKVDLLAVFLNIFVRYFLRKLEHSSSIRNDFPTKTFLVLAESGSL